MNKITDGTTQFIVRKIGGGGQLIKGIIMAFSGTFDSNGYPIDADTGLGDTGWHICDGTHGTPDLRGRFILGASDSHAVGSAGGEESHVLTVNEMPAHTHELYGSDNDIAPTTHSRQSDAPDSRKWTYDYRNWANSMTSTGNNAAHNNMPPYYTLSYIMKV